MRGDKGPKDQGGQQADGEDHREPRADVSLAATNDPHKSLLVCGWASADRPSTWDDLRDYSERAERNVEVLARGLGRE